MPINVKQAFNTWLNSPRVAKEDKDLLKAMNDAQLNEVFMSSLDFGTAGIRALMGPGNGRMNELTYAQMAYGYGMYVKDAFPLLANPTVVIAHDNRLHSDKFALVCADVLSSMDIQVRLFKDNELTATPILSWAIANYKAQGGIIVTASHNPKEYNGFKCYKHTGSQLMDAEAAKVKSHMNKLEDLVGFVYEPKKKLIGELPANAVDSYLAAVKKIQPQPKLDKSGIKVVYTAQHGTGSFVMPKLLRSLNYQFIGVSEQLVPDPMFSATSSSNPEEPISYDLAIEYARRNEAELILASDPDADRLGVAILHKGKWRFMTGNEMGILYVHYLTKLGKLGTNPYIVSSLVSTNLIDVMGKQHGIEIFRVGTGFKWMGNKIDEVNEGRTLVVAFEEAIGALNSDLNRDKDSFQAAVMAAEVFTYYKGMGMDFVDALEKEVFPRYGFWIGGTYAITFTEPNWKAMARARMDALRQYKPKRILKRTILSVGMDTVSEAVEWVLENNGWIKFRMSGTEPKFKIYFNLYGASTAELEAEREQLLAEIRSLLK